MGFHGGWGGHGRGRHRRTGGTRDRLGPFSWSRGRTDGRTREGNRRRGRYGSACGLGLRRPLGGAGVDASSEAQVEVVRSRDLRHQLLAEAQEGGETLAVGRVAEQQNLASGEKVRKVALCGGSGAFLVRDAWKQGADVLVTGDVKYHEAREAETLGLALIDAGHFATERPMIRGVAELLKGELANRKFTAEVLAFEGEREPFSQI
jgi:hypothetical protein